MARNKHKPQRMCVACRQSQDKKSLVRLVRTPEGVMVDQTGKQAGRGAYLHADPDCWERGVKKYLEKALNTSLSETNRAELIAFQDSFSNKNKE
ncbi:MAG TPA: YlxR family protein [Chloroflexi bacterium]|nr:YlxR family protein [Chloroflexota bacterium]